MRGGFSELVFDGSSPAPVSWVLCERSCDDAAARRATLYTQGDGGLNFAGAQALSYAVDVDEQPAGTTVTLIGGGQSYVYELKKNSAALELRVPQDSRIELATGSTFVPEQLPGFGQIYSRVRAVRVSSAGQEMFDEFEAPQSQLEVATGADVWAGIRNRYWALLLQPAQSGAATLSRPQQDRPAVSLAGATRYTLYAGPVEWQSLRSVAPELSEMLFAALWDFLRALTFGMMLLYGFIQGLVGNYGLAIVLLSLAVKILMSPLTALADRWQRQVNEMHSLLKPELDAIRREYKGEEAHTRTLDVYRKHNISQFYTFKSAAGFLIQIPVFIAAFDMLAENFALSEMAFLWVADLAKPDRLAALPVVIPFFGGYLNLLPFLMTFLSALAALLQQETSLSADLQRQQSLRLYLMSAAFFILFYTFPAGMVLYWTSSNLFHLLKVESRRLFVRE